MALPPFLRKPRIIAWLTVGYTGLTQVFTQFSSYKTAQRDLLGFRSTRGGLALRLNAKFPFGKDADDVPQPFDVEEIATRRYLYLSQDEEQGSREFFWLDVTEVPPATQSIGWVDEEVTSRETLVVYVPYSYRNQITAIKAMLDRHITASVRYRFDQ